MSVSRCCRSSSASFPDRPFQFAAGYLYGFIPGLLFSCIGAVIGTSISFFLAKLLGKDAVHLFFGEERMAYFLERLNSKRAYTIVFLLYVIPGLPKDVVSYAAGISEMKFKPFLILSLLGRIPGMAGSLLIGAFYMKEHYIGMAIVAVLAVCGFRLCVASPEEDSTNIWIDSTTKSRNNKGNIENGKKKKSGKSEKSSEKRRSPKAGPIASFSLTLRCSQVPSKFFPSANKCLFFS